MIRESLLKRWCAMLAAVMPEPIMITSAFSGRMKDCLVESSG
jgi:hypothetical protein